MMIWRPPSGNVRAKKIATRVDHVTKKDVFYRVWPAHLPEPPGNPVKLSGATLREMGYEVESVEDEA